MFRAMVFFGLLMSMSAQAAVQLAPQDIVRIDTGWAMEGIYITPSPTIEAENCEKQGIVLQNDHPYFDQILSIALSAMHGDKKVRFRVDGCTTNGNLVLNAIQVIN